MNEALSLWLFDQQTNICFPNIANEKSNDKGMRAFIFQGKIVAHARR